jgi:hypothetical protein
VLQRYWGEAHVNGSVADEAYVALTLAGILLQTFPLRDCERQQLCDRIAFSRLLASVILGGLGKSITHSQPTPRPSWLPSSSCLPLCGPVSSQPTAQSITALACYGDLRRTVLYPITAPDPGMQKSILPARLETAPQHDTLLAQAQSPTTHKLPSAPTRFISMTYICLWHCLFIASFSFSNFLRQSSRLQLSSLA